MMRKPRERNTNTKLARDLAGLYEQIVGAPFPGGHENAYICRTYAGYHQRSEGAWSWTLEMINGELASAIHGITHPVPFGSQWPAREAMKDPDEYLLVGY